MCKSGNCGISETCDTCERQYTYCRSKGHLRSICGTCVTNRRREKIRRKIYDYIDVKCVECGYDKCKRAIVFHHADPDSKEFEVSRNFYAYAWERLKREIDKCVILCSNCHMELECESDWCNHQQ